jgi:hypothetical protein
MNTKLLAESVGIFNSPEKWNALFELHEQTGQIMDHWLSIGAKALIDDFKNNPSPGWVCRKWDQDHEVRWHLETFEEKPIGIGFGWSTWEYHLFIWRGCVEKQNRAAELLKKTEFQALLKVFGPQDNVPRRTGNGSLACDVTLNPIGSMTAPEPRRRELAWLAAHQTEEFVRRMSSVIRQITDNSTFTALLEELNRRAQSETYATETPHQD